ncbi:MAG: hypothetical protein JJU29_15515 [Verrucomicrobia bacterium]|nr:hypothetical protein [Verrucomicrobiota bacterium]
MNPFTAHHYLAMESSAYAYSAVTQGMTHPYTFMHKKLGPIPQTGSFFLAVAPESMQDSEKTHRNIRFKGAKIMDVVTISELEFLKQSSPKIDLTEIFTEADFYKEWEILQTSLRKNLSSIWKKVHIESKQ